MTEEVTDKVEVKDDKAPTWKVYAYVACIIVGFLATQWLNSLNSKIDEQASTVKAQAVQIQAVCDRITKIEANYTYIATGIQEIKSQNQDLVKAFNSHILASDTKFSRISKKAIE